MLGEWVELLLFLGCWLDFVLVLLVWVLFTIKVHQRPTKKEKKRRNLRKVIILEIWVFSFKGGKLWGFIARVIVISLLEEKQLQGYLCCFSMFSCLVCLLHSALLLLLPYRYVPFFFFFRRIFFFFSIEKEFSVLIYFVENSWKWEVGSLRLFYGKFAVY